MSELCINCKRNPIYIKKRMLCRPCYNKLYKDMHKKQAVWPISDEVIHGDIQKEVQKNPEYKKFIKNQANESVNDLIKENKL